MSAIRLLVLGAVRQHGRAHGYQVRGDLEFWGAHEWSNAKPGSIYHALKQMAKQGLLLEALVRHDQKIDELTAGVGFIVDLPRAEAIGLLRQRLAALEGWRAEVVREW